MDMKLVDDHRLGDRKCASPNIMLSNDERVIPMYSKSELEANSPRIERTAIETSFKSRSSSLEVFRVDEGNSSLEYKNTGTNSEQDEARCVEAFNDGSPRTDSTRSGESLYNPDSGLQ